MKKFVLILLVFFAFFIDADVFSQQDTILMRNGTKIVGKVLEIDKYEGNLFFNLSDDPEGFRRREKLSEVVLIKFRNGKEEIFPLKDYEKEEEKQAAESSSELSEEKEEVYHVELKKVKEKRDHLGFIIGPNIGFGSFWDKDVNEVYSNPYGKFGITSGYWGKSWGVEANFSYSITKAQLPKYGSLKHYPKFKLGFASVDISGYFGVSKNKTILYMGGGAGYASFVEKIEDSLDNKDGEHYNIRNEADSFYAKIGVGMKIRHFFWQIDFSTVPLDSKINFGGITANFGLFL